MKKYIKIILILFFLGIIGCDKDSNIVNPEEPLQITVINQFNQPVYNATIEGGFDWTHYGVQTDLNGKATLPNTALNKQATIYKTNHLPNRIRQINSSTYILNQTSKKLELIGDVDGRVIQFNQRILQTLDYGGVYHLYSFTDESVVELFSQQLHDSAIAIRKIKIFNDTLWFSTHNSGIFVFNIVNPYSPQILFRLSIDGYLGPFIVNDSLIVTADPWYPAPVRIFRYYPTGQFYEISRFKNYFVHDLAYIDHAIIIFGSNDCLPTIFDISNPNTPILLYNGLEWDYTYGFLYSHYAFLAPKHASTGNPYRLEYKTLNLIDPANPTQINSFWSDSWLTEFASSSIALGEYYDHNQTKCILEGGLTSSFKTIATVSENTIDGFGGNSPPYFVIGNRLWKLTEQ